MIRRIAALLLLSAAVPPLSAASVRVVVSPESGVVFPGEAASWGIEAVAPAASTLEWTVRDDASRVVGTGRYTFKSDGSHRIEVPVATGGCGYYSMTVEVNDGNTVVDAESAVAIVPRSRTYGRFDRRNFFGLAGADRNPAMVEKLGGKISRLWMAPGWVRFGRDGSMDFSRFDRQVEAALKAHLAIVLVLTLGSPEQFPAWSGWTKPGQMVSPENLHYWTAFVRGVAEHYKDKLYAIEIQNEPDIYYWHRSNLSLAQAADDYARALKASAAVIREVAPNVRVFGLDVSGRDFGANNKRMNDMPGNLMFTRAVLDRAAGAMDAVSAHPYSHYRIIDKDSRLLWPEEHDLCGLLDQVGSLMEQHGRPRCLVPTELGWMIRDFFSPVWDTPYRQLAAVVARALTQMKSVRGVEQVIWFHLHAHSASEPGTYNLAKCPVPEAKNYRTCNFHAFYPTPAAAAFAAVAWALDDTVYVGKPSLAPGLSVWEFRRGGATGEQIIVLWAHGEGKYRLAFKADRAVSVFSMFSRRIASGPDLDLAVDYQPLFLIGPAAAAKQTLAALRRAQLKPADPLTVNKVYRLDPAIVAATIGNHTAAPQTVELALGDRKWTRRLATGTNSVRLDYSGSSRKLTVNGPGMPEIAGFIGPDNYYEVVKAENPEALLPLFDSPRALVLDTTARLMPPDSPWTGSADLSVRAVWGWNERELLLAADVTDNVNWYDASAEGFSFGDSLQLALDYDGDSTSGFNADDRELALVQNGRDGAICRQTWPQPARRLDGVGLKIVREGNRTRYLARIPWAVLHLSPPVPGRTFSLNFIVNDNDGEGRRGWMGLTPGIGESKRPGSYRRCICRP